MGILEKIAGELDHQMIEVVTLPKDLTEGVDSQIIRSFPNKEQALEYANTLPKATRDASFIRTSDEVQTLDKAEAELNENVSK